MRPEQALGQETDYRSDQFSFGLILYEMASGKQAFAKPSSVETMAAIHGRSIVCTAVQERQDRWMLTGYRQPGLWNEIKDAFHFGRSS